jgi:hypothetical protein
MLEGDAELGHAEMAVVARNLSLRDIPRVGNLVSRRHTNHQAIVADLEPNLLYLSRCCIARGSILWIGQDVGVQVNTLRDWRRHLLTIPLGVRTPTSTFIRGLSLTKKKRC